MALYLLSWYARREFTKGTAKALKKNNVGTIQAAQIGAIIYLTYDIGWDIMEPSTYLLGLAYSAWVMLVHNLTTKEFAFPVHVEAVIEKYRSRVYEKNKFSPGACAILCNRRI